MTAGAVDNDLLDEQEQERIVNAFESEAASLQRCTKVYWLFSYHCILRHSCCVPSVDCTYAVPVTSDIQIGMSCAGCVCTGCIW